MPTIGSPSADDAARTPGVLRKACSALSLSLAVNARCIDARLSINTRLAASTPVLASIGSSFCQLRNNTLLRIAQASVTCIKTSAGIRPWRRSGAQTVRSDMQCSSGSLGLQTGLNTRHAQGRQYANGQAHD